MKLIGLTLLAIMLACESDKPSFEKGVLPDGGPAVIVTCPDMTETECTGYISQQCPNGYEIVQKDQRQSMITTWHVMASCPKKF